MMDIDHLSAFVAVARNGSFSVTANQLYLTQPAISKRIAALEGHLGAPLFDRIGRRVQLTQAGMTLLPRAENILLQLQEAKRAMADLSGEIGGELRVATSHHLGLHKLPPMLRAFASQYPKVNLQFEFLDSEVAHDRVLRGLCELAVVTLAPTPIAQLICEPIWRDPLCFVTQADQNNPPTTLEELSREAAILPDLKTYTGRLVKACFDERGLPLELNMATNYLETIKMMVSVGLGWSVLPEAMVDEQLQVLPVQEVELQRDLGVVRHQKRHLSNAANAFYTLLIANRTTDVAPKLTA